MSADIIQSQQSNSQAAGSSLSPSCVSPRRRTGRPTRLTPERLVDLAAKVRRGVPVEVAAPACGINPDSFYYWMERGNQDKANGLETIYSEFSEAIYDARDQLEAELAEKWIELASEGLEKVKRVYKEQVVTKEDGSYEVVKYLDSETIETIGGGDWKGISEYLLRRFPSRWARKEGVELTGKDGGPIETHSTIAIDSLSVGLRGWLLLELEGRKLPEEVEVQVNRLIAETVEIL